MHMFGNAALACWLGCHRAPEKANPLPSPNLLCYYLQIYNPFTYNISKFMAVEAHQFYQDLLARLPQDHPDRPFLEGVAQTVSAYVERTNAALNAELWQAPDGDASADETTQV